MRLIIDNDQYQLYARTDYALSEITLTNGALVAGNTSIAVINASGLATNDYILIEDIGNERAELRQVTVSGLTLTVSALTFDHASKTRVFRLQYDKVKFYEDDTVIATVSITPDYFTKYTQAIDADKTYSISYFNTQTSIETPRGEVLNGWEYNLCSVGDCLQYESNGVEFGRLLDKINISSREIRSAFISQDQNFTDLSSRDIARLREPTALRALYYNFAELIKQKEDVPTTKADLYSKLYTAKLNEVLEVINKGNQKVKVWGQSRVLR
jgi:hypothetical protein